MAIKPEGQMKEIFEQATKTEELFADPDQSQSYAQHGTNVNDQGYQTHIQLDALKL